MSLQEENLALKEKLKQLERNGGLNGELYFEKGMYWLRTPTDDGTNIQGPFCQVCQDRDKRLVRLHRRNAPGGGWFCAACQNTY